MICSLLSLILKPVFRCVRAYWLPTFQMNDRYAIAVVDADSNTMADNVIKNTITTWIIIIIESIRTCTRV